MLRRSRRLSGAKEARHCNGGVVSKKKIKVDDNDVRNYSEDGEIAVNNKRVIILKFILFDSELKFVEY